MVLNATVHAAIVSMEQVVTMLMEPVLTGAIQDS